jgi:hypothetical protein
MTTPTTNMNWSDPIVGADSDTWGDKTNAIWDNLDSHMAGVLYGLTLSAAGSTATFGVAAGAASGMVLASAFTKTTSAWGVGTGQGALDTGAIANSTWYHVYLIQRTDTSVVDILVSTSASSPTMPTNYTRKRRIGAMLTDGSAQWVKFTQIGNDFLWSAPPRDINYAPTTAQSAKTLTVPTGVKVRAKLRGFAEGTTGVNTSMLVSSPDEATTAASDTNATVIVSSGVFGSDIPWSLDVWTNTSGQVNCVASNSGATNLLRAATISWTDLRGQ